MDKLHELCIEAINEMVKEGITKHISYASEEDELGFALEQEGLIPKVTIEWVDASEADGFVA